MEAILFDIGGVVIQIHNLMEKAHKVFQVENTEEFWRIFNEVGLPTCRGEQSIEECWQEMARRLEVEISEEDQHGLWIEEFERDIEIDDAVVDLIDNLRGRYRVAVVSNTIEEHAEVIRDLGVYNHFETAILSHEVGMTKDNPEIFSLALKQLQVSAEKTAFVDDVEKFVLSAEKKGIKGVLFKDLETLKSDLLGLGFEV